MSKQRKSTNKWKSTKVKWHTLNPGPHDCWICKQPIINEEDVTLDHVADWATYPEYRYELSNLRPAHAFCNNERQAKQLQKLKQRGVIKKIR